jgi:FixJ family two-component response regulator
MRLALEDLVRSVGLEVRAFAAPQEFLQAFIDFRAQITPDF